MTLALTSLPVKAAPVLETFSSRDTGIMGCQGVAGKRGSYSWQGPKYAAWDLVGQNEQGTMTLKINGQLRSFAYTESHANNGENVRMSGRLGQYTVDIFVDFSKRTGYESSGGDGAIRIYSSKPGDSQSYPITAMQGC